MKYLFQLLLLVVVYPFIFPIFFLGHINLPITTSSRKAPSKKSEGVQMAFAGLADLRLFDNVSQYINTLAGEFSPDTSHLHDHNCKCSIVDRLWCDYFG
ncbi:hypothetical protein B9Z55_000027 [Caenorhabditis nigoni]|uniref:Uncharacterized protein n=1 Tax=Caenorhabditis nigoni TaxID=1611254 RepID=A0A2G5VLQ2_9PELO|nr:hypothetical protein B9Z55_000027 [Caenorhabditis nigoni]